MTSGKLLIGAIGVVIAAGAAFGSRFQGAPGGIKRVVARAERIARVRLRSVVAKTYDVGGLPGDCGQVVRADVVESLDGETTAFEFFLPTLQGLAVGKEYLAIVFFCPASQLPSPESLELSQLGTALATEIQRCRRYEGLRAGYTEQSVFEIVRGAEGGAVPPGEWLVELSKSVLEGDDIVLDRRRFSESNYRSSETIVPWTEARAAILEAFKEKTARLRLQPTPRAK